MTCPSVDAERTSYYILVCIRSTEYSVLPYVVEKQGLPRRPPTGMGGSPVCFVLDGRLAMFQGAKPSPEAKLRSQVWQPLAGALLLRTPYASTTYGW